MKQLKVAIIGVGARGGETYGVYIHENKEKFKIVSLCDKNLSKLEKYGSMFDVPVEGRFIDENDFFEKKRGDILIIATLDRDHVRIARKAIALGYSILLEKPISHDEEELRALVKDAKNAGVLIVVCHVLRYTAAICKIKELLDSGIIGKLIFIDDLEQVAYWHFAHSYVRGNWKRSEETAPSILAKCCHDLDLLQYFAKAPCKSVSSMGNLSFFKPESAPIGCAERCLDCKAAKECPYNAKKIYVDDFIAKGCPIGWPYTVLTDEELCEKNLLKALKEGPYGRCVFSGDNNVADNQCVMAEFENGVYANLRMMAFTAGGGRRISFYGSAGEIIFDEASETIECKPFGEDVKVFNIKELTEDLSGHGGGDHRMIDALYEAVCNGINDFDTSIVNSVESHLMAVAAEKSRIAGGKLIAVHCRKGK